MAKKTGFFRESDEDLNQDTLLAYKEALSRYPYCQYAHLMFLLNLKKTGDEAMFKSTLPYTAIMLPDRIRLKEHVSTQAEPCPIRSREGFSPLSQALPVKSRNRTAGRTLQPSEAASGIDPEIGFRPIAREITPQREESMPGRREAAPQREESIPGRGEAVPQREESMPQARVEPTVQERIHSARAQADAIINRFMQGNEHLISIDEDFDYNSFDPDTGGSNREDFSMGGEALAEIYLRNGSPQKAIAVYENMRLNFPEKSSYFANLIKEVKRDYFLK